jgi:endonuclease-3
MLPLLRPLERWKRSRHETCALGAPPMRRSSLSFRKTLSLTSVVEVLRKHYGRPPAMPTSDLFELILLENIAYLASPGRKRLAFEKLMSTVGTQPHQILSAGEDLLNSVALHGILRKATVAKLRECARIAIETFAGDVNVILRESSQTAATRLQVFPSIGKPGAERILLFANRLLALAPESNGVRVLARLGMITEHESYGKTYKETQGIALGPYKRSKDFQEANLLLQTHGRELCRRKNPMCADCPLRSMCKYALEKNRRT